MRRCRYQIFKTAILNDIIFSSKSILKMKNLAFFLLLVFPQILFALAQKCPDTLFLKTGERWAVKISSIKNEQVFYQSCDENKGLKLTIPLDLVEKIQSPDPKFRVGNFSEKEKQQIAEEVKLQKEAKSIRAWGLFSGLANLLFGIGLVFSIWTLVRALLFLRKTKNMPRTPFVKKVRRWARRGIFNAFLLPLILLAVISLLVFIDFALG